MKKKLAVGLATGVFKAGELGEGATNKSTLLVKFVLVLSLIFTDYNFVKMS